MKKILRLLIDNGIAVSELEELIHPDMPQILQTLRDNNRGLETLLLFTERKHNIDDIGMEEIAGDIDAHFTKVLNENKDLPF